MKNIVCSVVTVIVIIFATNALTQETGGPLEPSTDMRVTLAHAVAEINNLKSSIESLRAAIESNSHLIRSQNQNADLKLRDMDARIASLEERLKIQGRQVTSAVSTVAPEVAAEAELYQLGLNQINNSEFLKAIATLKKFKQKYPKSPYVDDAQYWIAECYFAMRDFEMAIKEFQNVIDNYRKSEKVPAALLKQGYAFMELEMENDAKLFHKTLMKKYPSTKEAKEAKDYWKRQDELKEQAASKPNMAPGGIPLAPGVAVPDEKKKPTRSGKYD